MLTPVQSTTSEVVDTVQFSVSKSFPVSDTLYLHVIVSPWETDSGKNVEPPEATKT